ncbi:MAG: UDP-N-acetylmuramoyl-L-alanine--D-glutamate ligase [Thermodesulfobacteriota bacterium]
MSIVNRQLKIGTKVLVVGLGKSGIAAAHWLAHQGAVVTVSEARDESVFDSRLVADLSHAGIELQFGDHRVASFLDTDFIVISPGVPLDITPVAAAVDRGVPVMGELELAWRNLSTPSIAVTGTNGKSTVVKLIGEMLSQAGSKVFVGGNIDVPLTRYIEGPQDADYVVLEVSSFQLDTALTFSPLVSVVLNISPDHLDRYPDYEAYIRSKKRIFENQGPDQSLILNDEDPLLQAVEPTRGPRVYRYGINKQQRRQCFMEQGRIAVEMPGSERLTFGLDQVSLSGIHNRENIMAAILAALVIDTPADGIQKGINSFKGLPHRIEFVGTLGGVDFYNDSKATNISAAIQSITSFSRPVVLIAGGKHKGSDYLPLVNAAEGRVKNAVLIGEAGILLADAFDGRIPWSEAGTMDDAVSRAYGRSQEGDVVLLAPACSSFDMFTNYQHRGAAFREAVNRLKHDRQR